MVVNELSDWGFEYCCSQLNLRHRVCFEEEVSWHLGKCRVTLKRICDMIRTHSLLVILAIIFEYVYLHTFHVSVLLKRHLCCDHRISCSTHYLEWTDNKLFCEMIGPRHIAINRAVAHQIWVARCSPRTV